jgi:hypothetical protein
MAEREDFNMGEYGREIGDETQGEPDREFTLRISSAIEVDLALLEIE